MVAHTQRHVDLKSEEKPKILSGITTKKKFHINIMNHGFQHIRTGLRILSKNETLNSLLTEESDLMRSLIIIGTAIARIGWIRDDDSETDDAKKQADPSDGDRVRVSPEGLILGEFSHSA
jgi:hypothetical protein